MVRQGGSNLPFMTYHVNLYYHFCVTEFQIIFKFAVRDASDCLYPDSLSVAKVAGHELKVNNSARL